MRNWMTPVNGEPLPWLLERDSQNPGVRYFALRDLLDRPVDDQEVVAARCALMSTGPVPAILAAQDPEGYWVEPGPGYRPKYRSTVWSVIMLAQVGADGNDPQVRKAGDYLLDYRVGFRGSASTIYEDEVLDVFLNLQNPNDRDGDGLEDWWEDLYSCMMADTVDSATDYEPDGLTNMSEFMNGTDPCLADSDGSEEHDTFFCYRAFPWYHNDI